METTHFPDVMSRDSKSLTQPLLKVVGLGGGGCNAVERMIELGMKGVEFVAANTDYQTLMNNPAKIKLQLGPKTTRGLGSGGDPNVGRLSAEESRREIEEALNGADMVFLTTGLGGGTGTGSIPIAAEIARSIGAVTIAIVTTPFSFEVGRRQQNARDGLKKLREHTNTLISIPNDRLLYVAPRDLPLETAFRLADDVLRQSVQGISELVTEPGMINVDFAHIRRLVKSGGGAMMAVGYGEGEDKTAEAVKQALFHPLLESVSLENAGGIIANFTGGEDLSLFEVENALNELQAQTGRDTEIIMGVMQDESMEGRAQVILVITGLGSPTLEETVSKFEASEIEDVQKEVQDEVKEVEQEDVHERQPLEPRTSPLTMPTGSPNLDIPAFLRRRAGYSQG